MSSSRFLVVKGGLFGFRPAARVLHWFAQEKAVKVVASVVHGCDFVLVSERGVAQVLGDERVDVVQQVVRRERGRKDLFPVQHGFEKVLLEVDLFTHVVLVHDAVWDLFAGPGLPERRVGDIEPFRPVGLAARACGATMGGKGEGGGLEK